MRYAAEVTDPFGRPRWVVIEVRPGHVGILGPPGDGFTVDADQCDALAYYLRAAADNARGYRATSQHREHD